MIMKFMRALAIAVLAACYSLPCQAGLLQIGISPTENITPGSLVSIDAVWKNAGADSLYFPTSWNGSLLDGRWLMYGIGFGFIWDSAYNNYALKNVLELNFSMSSPDLFFGSLRGKTLLPGETVEFSVGSFVAPIQLNITTLNHLIVGDDCMSAAANQLCDPAPFGFTTSYSPSTALPIFYDVAQFVSATPIPEPNTDVLLLSALGFLAIYFRHRMQKTDGN